MTLLIHGALEPSLVDLPAAPLRHHPGQIQRESEGVIQLEGQGARDACGPSGAAAPVAVSVPHLMIENLEAPVQRLAETPLLLVTHLDDHTAPLHQFTVYVA